jgi:hypothetical protein
MTKRKAPLKRKKPLFSHHKHSGKRLAHHHTHYLPLLFLVIITGFLLAGISHTAGAADIAVRAKVSAPLPTVPAVITSPSSGQVYTDIPVNVQGTCPEGYLIKLYRNNFFSGSTVCAAGDTFNISSDLFTGSNELTARVYNITDDEGPASPPVFVEYTPPVAALPNSSDTNSPDELTADENVPQFVLKAENTYKGYVVGDKITWELEATGGISPYAFSADWGDGSTDVISRKKEGKFKIIHEYDSSGELGGSFTIRIKGTDQSGQEVFMQLVVLVNSPAGISSSSPQVLWPASSLHPLQPSTIIWGSYFGMLVGVAGFWFGGLWQTHQLATQSILHKRIVRRR